MRTQTLIGLALMAAAVLMLVISFQTFNVVPFLLSFPVGFIGFYNALRPTVADRQRKDYLERQRLEENYHRAIEEELERRRNK